MVQGRGVVDQDVDLAELILDLLEHVANLLTVGHVHLDRECLAAHLANLFRGAVGMDPALRHRHLRQHAALRLGGLLQLRIVLNQYVSDDDVGALAGEGERILPAQTARRAGDHRDPAC